LTNRINQLAELLAKCDSLILSPSEIPISSIVNTSLNSVFVYSRRSDTQGI